MLIELRDALAADAGGKARGLARLAAAGLPVPPGFALTGAAFTAVAGPIEGAALDDVGAALAARAEAAGHAPIDPALERAVIGRARALGPRLAVRSSMTIEDGAAAAAPGLGTTVLDVEPDAVWPAIRAVWAAALTPIVIAYARRLGGGGAPIAAPGVIVQRMADGDRATVYTRPPGRPDADEAWIARGGATERVTRDRGRADVALALAAEAAIGARAGADVELVGGDGGWAIVQARPLVHPPPRPPRRPPPPIVLAPLRNPPRAWRRDVTHNPAPLSVAQAELCARVEAAAIAPFHLAVVASHLYWAPRAGSITPPVTSADDFAARAEAAERALAALLAAPALATVDDAVARYLDAYRILAGELGPLIAGARAVLPAALAARGLPPSLAAALTSRRPSSIAARLAGVARGAITRDALLAAIGDAAPAWDVMVPTFAESPGLVDDAVARAAARPPPPDEPPTPDGLAAEVAIARAAADASERDDLWYWRVQAVVRRALLAAAARTGLSGDDVFWLPFAELEAIDRVAARGRAAAARAAAARAAAWDLPLTLDEPAPDRAAARWAGLGLGSIVAGPVHRADGGAPIPRGAIAVVRAVTPALAIALDGAAAIVSEHGTLLDHGAAMARELGIPCVVGCRGIYDDVADGAWVTVDGDHGTVYCNAP